MIYFLDFKASYTIYMIQNESRVSKLCSWSFKTMWGGNYPTLLETQNFMTPCYFGAPLFDDIRQVWLLVSESLYLIHDQPKPQNNTWSKNVFPEEVVTHAVILYFWFLWPVHKHVLRDTSLKDAFSHLSYTAGTFALLLPVPFLHFHIRITSYIHSYLLLCTHVRFFWNKVLQI